MILLADVCENEKCLRECKALTGLVSHSRILKMSADTNSAVRRNTYRMRCAFHFDTTFIFLGMEDTQQSAELVVTILAEIIEGISSVLPSRNGSILKLYIWMP
jgi:hypothetical protein